MAISGKKLHFEVLRRVNRVASEYNAQLLPDEIDSYLNEAKGIVYDNRLALLETNPQIREDLREMEAKKVCLDCIKHKNDNKCCVVTFPSDYYRRVRQTASIYKDKTCKDKEAIIRIVSSDKLSECLTDPFRKPSYEYEELLGDEAENGLLVYHNNTCAVKKVCVDYFRKLEDIATPSLSAEKFYINSEGDKVEADTGLQITAPNFVRQVLDIAALIAARDLGAIKDFQTQLNKILSVERIYITN